MISVLYHKNCVDGIVAAFVMQQFFKRTNKEFECIAVNYGEPPPNVAGNHVYVVDFSYNPEQIEELSKVCKSITMLDHHESAAKNWGGYGCKFFTQSEGSKANTLMWLIEEMSGAGIALSYVKEMIKQRQDLVDFTKNDRLNWLVSRIQDRDLWKFEFGEESKIVHAMINYHDYSFDLLEQIVFRDTQDELERRLALAEGAYRTREKMAKGFARLAKVVPFHGHKVAMINCPAEFSSVVGDILSKEHPLALMWCASNERVFISLRSNSDTGVNVEELASLHGGGGHIHAAGFGLKITELPQLLLGQF